MFEVQGDASAAGSSLESSWAIADGAELPVAFIWWRGTKVVCIHCDSLKNNLFTNAWQFRPQKRHESDGLFVGIAAMGAGSHKEKRKDPLQFESFSAHTRYKESDGLLVGITVMGAGSHKEKRKDPLQLESFLVMFLKTCVFATMQLQSRVAFAVRLLDSRIVVWNAML